MNKKTLIILPLFLLCVSFVSALGMTETVSTTEVKPGGKITVTYTPTGLVYDKAAYVVKRNLPEGWYIENNPAIIIQEDKYAILAGTKSAYWFDINAPVTPGQYTFTGGTYAISDVQDENTYNDADGKFPDFTVAVLEAQCTSAADCEDVDCYNKECVGGECKYTLIPNCLCDPTKIVSCGPWSGCEEGDESESRNCENECGTTILEERDCGGGFDCDKAFSFIGLGKGMNCIAGIFLVMFMLMFMMRMMPRR